MLQKYHEIEKLIENIPATGQRHALLVVSCIEESKKLLTYLQNNGCEVQMRDKNVLIAAGILSIRSIDSISNWHVCQFSDVIMPNNLDCSVKKKILARWRSTYVNDGQLFMY